jgi:hypothetical protein
VRFFQRLADVCHHVVGAAHGDALAALQPFAHEFGERRAVDPFPGHEMMGSVGPHPESRGDIPMLELGGCFHRGAHHAELFLVLDDAR